MLPLLWRTFILKVYFYYYFNYDLNRARKLALRRLTTTFSAWRRHVEEKRNSRNYVSNFYLSNLLRKSFGAWKLQLYPKYFVWHFCILVTF